MGDLSRFRALFESALQAYENNTGITLAEHPLAIKVQNCRSVEFVIALLQDQMRASSAFDRILKPIKGILSTLSTLSATTALDWAIGLTFSPENAIHVGFAILLAAAKGIEIVDDALVDVLESVERLFRHLDMYTKIPHSPALDEMVVKVVLELISILELATKRLTQGRLTSSVKNDYGDEGVKVVPQSLDPSTSGETRRTETETPEAVHGLVQNVDVVTDDGKPSIDGTSDELQSNIREWLSPPDPWKNHRIACESHHEGTATWFIKGDMFSEWKEPGRNCLLWIHGKPGAGKSIICSTIIEEIEAMRKSGLACLAFYYHDFRDDQKKNLRGLLSSLLFQLCKQSDVYHDILATFYSTHGYGKQRPSDDELALCLKGLLQLSGRAPVYLIVDALDECRNTSTSPARSKVLMLVEDLVNSKHPNLRICVTSRPEDDMKVSLQPLAFHSVSIHDEIGQLEDIENYIKSVVKTNRRMQRWKPEDKQLVIDVLTSLSDGMFRWVYCQLEYLGGCIPGRIRRALDELPETLDGTYERTLRGIKSTDWEIARRLFQCVAVASRPLRAQELAEFLAFDFKAEPIPKFREEWRLEDSLEAVLSTCSTLLALVNVGDSPVIQFSHFSVQEFLTSTRFAEKRDNISCRYHVSMTPAHTLVAQACLSTLLYLDGNVTEDVLKEFPLTEYAAEHLVEHAQCEGVSENAEEGIKQLFDRRKRHLTVWFWIYDPMWLVEPWRRGNRSDSPQPARGSCLHWATFFGFYSIVKSLAIERPEDIRSRDFGDKSTPLHLSSIWGHAEVARFLIEHGADTMAKDTHQWTPLHHAVEKENEDISRLLLDHGANVKARDWARRTPLHLAVRNRREDIARLLLKHGAPTTAKDKNAWCPLHYALWQERGGPESLSVPYHGLPGTDATVKAQCGWTPSGLAVQLGREDITCLLLKHGANATARDKDGWTPLHWATWNGTEALARLLLEHGADATAKDKYGSTLLHRAVGSGKEALVRVFLEHGADVTATDRNGWTPLRCAVEQGREDLAHLLIEHGADESTSLHVEHDAQCKHGRLTHLRHRIREVWYEPIASTLGRTQT